MYRYKCASILIICQLLLLLDFKLCVLFRPHKTGDEGMASNSTISPFDPEKEQWNCYSERLDFYFEANTITEIDQKKAIILTVVGPTTYQLLKSLVQPQKPKEKTYPELKELLEKYYHLKPSAIVRHFRFHTRVRETGQSVATYVMALCDIGEHCDFKDTMHMIYVSVTLWSFGYLSLIDIVHRDKKIIK